MMAPAVHDAGQVAFFVSTSFPSNPSPISNSALFSPSLLSAPFPLSSTTFSADTLDIVVNAVYNGPESTSQEQCSSAHVELVKSVDADTPPMVRRLSALVASSVVGMITATSLLYNAAFGELTPKSCAWLGLCGMNHLRTSTWRSYKALPILSHQSHAQNLKLSNNDFTSFWTSGKVRPEDWSDDERKLRDTPDYVFEYAPLIHLYSGEEFWPGDIAEHLVHTTPYLNFTPITDSKTMYNLTNLNDLNQYRRTTYLTSDDNVEDRPKWLGARYNIPATGEQEPKDASGEDLLAEIQMSTEELFPNIAEEESNWLENEKQPRSTSSARSRGRPATRAMADYMSVNTEEAVQVLDEGASLDGHRMPRRASLENRLGGRSKAPTVLVVVDKGSGVVDAFWFFFYSYNLGNKVFNVRFGNHVGDWEHTLVRFKDGEPKAVFFSEHFFGEAYSYEAVEKVGKRPVGYSATGTHAMYGTPGVHQYILPFGLLHDVTDRGPLWDPALNYHGYTYDYVNDTLRSSTRTPQAPTEWFYFRGHWGDKAYPLDDPRQYRFVDQYHYENGPTGPRFKSLSRRRICPGTGPCVIKDRLDSTNRVKRWPEHPHSDDMGEVWNS